MSTGMQQTPAAVDLRTLVETDPKAALTAALEETARARAEVQETRQLAQMSLGKDGLEATNSAQLWWLAGIYYRSGAAPLDDMFAGSKRDGQRPRPERDVRARLFLKMTFGAELGLKPLQALQNVAIINNRPTIWGDAAKALVLQSGLCEYCYEREIGEKGKPSYGYECRTKRKGQEEEVTRFTVEDAQRAGLMGKPGDLYKLYPQRMLMFRARGFRLRDSYPDVLKGLITAEEAADISRERTRPSDAESFREMVVASDESAEPAPQAADSEQASAGEPSETAADDTEQSTPQPVAGTDESTQTSQPADDQAIAVALWLEEVKGLESLTELAEAKRSIPATFNAADQQRVLSAIEMREAEIRGKRGSRYNKQQSMLPPGVSATEAGL